VIAAAWGFAEATLFFLVPDVWLTRVALDDRRGALRGCLLATAGALAGGALMWWWGSAAPETALDAVERVPAVAPAMVGRVRDELVASGWLAVVLGPTTGTPYKLYATQAGALGLPLLGLLAITVPARLLRFVGLVLLAAAVSRGPLAGWPLRRRQALHLAMWAAFYAAYLAAVDW
jgi:membrane protein YqaA with SNARE-associated domain